MVPQLPLLVLSLAFAAFPSVDAALFSKKSNVQQVDAKGFRKALHDNGTFVTAFVAPWCGHCQKLAPELTRAADGLHPLVPVYAIDCDDGKNKPLCAEQDVKGFPTIKLYPRGKQVAPLEFDGTRTASSLFYWASRAVPSTISRSQTAKGVAEIVANNPGKPKAVLLNKSNKTPLLWKVLSNKYSNQIVFGNCRDRKGKVSVEMGFEKGEQSKPKVLVYGPNDKEPILYEGILKFDALSKFFEQVLEGSIDISRASHDAKQEILKVPESERTALDDDVRIGDAGYAGFNPHEGMDMNDLLKHGPNPHAAGHPGGADPHAAAHAAAASSSSPPRAAESSSATEALSAASDKVTEAASAASQKVKEAVSAASDKATTAAAKEESTLSAASETVAEPHTTAAAEEPTEPVEPSPEPVKETVEPTTEHAKDEL